MSKRKAQIDAILADAGWQKATRQALAGDLSSRRYMRLTNGDQTAILMDANESMEAFRDMTRWLRNAGFSAPQILADHAKEGLILLEDFGDTSLNARNGDYAEIDMLCIDLLLALRAETPPDLSCPDAEALVAWTEEADHFYVQGETSALQPFRAVLQDALQQALTITPTLSLRDFHADNVMWLPDRQEIKRLGLLDYQDAFLTHPVYDLVSYLTDARVDISPVRRAKVLSIYLDRSGDDWRTFTTAFAAFSAQRNLRILGIFAKAAKQGKRHHLPKLPRVHCYLIEALNHDLFRDVKAETIAALPDPVSIVEALS